MKKLMLLFLTVAAIQTAAFAQQTISKSYDGIQEIDLNIHVGDLNVERTNGNVVEVEVS